jgi:hypothetical protein
MQAYVQVGGETVAASEVVTLVAPADSEIFHINLPASQNNPNSQEASNITGIVDLNGYVPTGATIAIAAQQAGQNGYNTVVSGLSATDGIAWSWTQAGAGSSYAIKAYLMVSGNIVSQSNAISVTAPGANEVLVINSTASSPSPQTVSVTGSVNLNGVIPQGATLSVASRPTGTQAFSIFASNLPLQRVQFGIFLKQPKARLMIFRHIYWQTARQFLHLRS